MLQFDTKKVDLDLDGLPISILRITNVSELMDAFIARDPEDELFRDERFPYWADLWHSAIGLGRYLVQSKFIQKGTRVTELGCGLGFSDIVAGKLGAAVTFTDYLREPLDFAKQNWELNCTNDAQYELMDWRNPKPALAAELILAADVAYEERSFDPLRKTFDQLYQPNGKIIISEPNRKRTVPFIQALAVDGWQIEKTVLKEHLDAFTATVNIFTLQRA